MRALLLLTLASPLLALPQSRVHPPRDHEGRIRVVGKDLEQRAPRGVEVKWKEYDPFDKDEALRLLKQLREKLKPAERALREKTWKAVASWIKRLDDGGVLAWRHRYAKTFHVCRYDEGRDESLKIIVYVDEGYAFVKRDWRHRGRITLVDRHPDHRFDTDVRWDEKMPLDRKQGEDLLDELEDDLSIAQRLLYAKLLKEAREWIEDRAPREGLKECRYKVLEDRTLRTTIKIEVRKGLAFMDLDTYEREGQRQ